MDTFQNQIKLLTKIVDEVSVLVNETGALFKGKEIDEIKLEGFLYLDLIQKINANFEGLFVLLQSYEKSQELKTPLSLVCRCLLSDILTGYYLSSFIEDSESFKNEVNVLGLDYVGYIDFLLRNPPNKSINPIFQEKKSDILKEISNYYPDLIDSYDDKGLIKVSKKNLRKTTKDSFFPSEKEKNKRISDDYKFERLNQHNTLSDVSYIYHLLRYFSQFQHYCYQNRYTSNLPPNEVFNFIVQAAYYSVNALYTFFHILKVPEKNNIEIENYLMQFEAFPEAMVIDK